MSKKNFASCWACPRPRQCGDEGRQWPRPDAGCHLLPRAQRPHAPRQTVRQPRRSPLALGAAERQNVLEVLHAPEYVDLAPHTVYAMLLDVGRSLASISTFYRILRETSGPRPRRNELVHPA